MDNPAEVFNRVVDERDRLIPSHPSKNDQSSGPHIASERYVAERLAKEGRIRQELRWIDSGPKAGMVLWNGRYWAATGRAVPLVLSAAVHEQVAWMLREHLIDNKTARQLESAAQTSAIARHLEGYDELKMNADELDPPGILVVPDGVIDLATGELLPHDPSRCVTRCTAVNAGEQGNDVWQRIVAHLATMGESVAAAMQRYIGAGLLGIPPDRRLHWWLGKGNDGKSTLIRALCGALGDYAATIPAEGLTPGGARGAHGHELLAGLAGARLAVATEVGEDLDWALIKSITGGDARVTKRLHGRNYTITPTAALVFASNRVPVVKSGDQAAADRIGIVSWRQPEDNDPEVAAVLGRPGPERDAVLSAALAWMLDGCSAFQRDGALELPGMEAPGMAAAEGVEAWWKDGTANGLIIPRAGWTPAASVIEAAQDWCQANGQGVPTKTAIGTWLKRRVASKRVGRGNVRTTTYGLQLGWDTVGHGLKRPPITCEEDGINHVPPCPIMAEEGKA